MRARAVNRECSVIEISIILLAVSIYNARRDTLLSRNTAFSLSHELYRLNIKRYIKYRRRKHLKRDAARVQLPFPSSGRLFARGCDAREGGFSLFITVTAFGLK